MGNAIRADLQVTPAASRHDAPPSTFAQRLARLIEVRYDGSTNKAAKAMDIRQSTLAPLVRGDAVNPQVETATKIARHFDVPEAWLVFGAGEAPDWLEGAPTVIAALIDWENFVSELSLSAPATARLRALGRSVVEQVAQLQGLRPWETAFPGQERAVRAMVVGTHTFFRAWVESAGRDAVAAILNERLAAPRGSSKDTTPAPLDDPATPIWGTFPPRNMPPSRVAPTAVAPALRSSAKAKAKVARARSKPKAKRRKGRS